MTNDLDSAETLIQLQAEVNGRILELSTFLSRRGEVDSATRMCEVRRYQEKSIFEVCVDVELPDTTAVSFWLEFGCEKNRWHVAASINRTFAEGQETIEEYPQAEPRSLEALQASAVRACDWLVGRGKEFDFAALN
jgi:hypothetical protein